MTSFLESGQLMGLHGSSESLNLTMTLELGSICAALEGGNSDEAFSGRADSVMIAC